MKQGVFDFYEEDIDLKKIYPETWAHDEYIKRLAQIENKSDKEPTHIIIEIPQTSLIDERV